MTFGRIFRTCIRNFLHKSFLFSNLIFIAFGFILCFYRKRLPHSKWVLLISPIFYLLSECYIALSVNGMLSGGDIGSLISQIGPYALMFSIGQTLGWLMSLLSACFKKQT